MAHRNVWWISKTNSLTADTTAGARTMRPCGRMVKALVFTRNMRGTIFRASVVTTRLSRLDSWQGRPNKNTWKRKASLHITIYLDAGVSRAGARTGLQLLGYGDIQRFNSSSLANVLRGHRQLSLLPRDSYTLSTCVTHKCCHRQYRAERAVFCRPPKLSSARNGLYMAEDMPRKRPGALPASRTE